MRFIQFAILTTAMLVPLGCKVACGQIGGSSRNETGAGGIAGAIIGGIVGKQNDETPEGIAIGAALGALAGNAVGNDRNRAYAQQQAYRQAAYQQQLAYQQAYQKAASIQDIVDMSQNGIGPEVIMNHLRNVGIQNEVGVSEIISLSRSGVDEQVIKMMQQMGNQRQTYAYPAPVRQVQPSYRTVPAPVITVERYVPVQRPCPYEARRRYEAQRAYQNHLQFHYRR